MIQNKYDNVVINNNEECFNNIKKYLDLVNPIGLDIAKLIRLGGKRDDGYVMFTPPISFHTAKSFIFFGLIVLLRIWKWPIKVIAYCNMMVLWKKGPCNHPNIIFYKKFIKSYSLIFFFF